METMVSAPLKLTASTIAEVKRLIADPSFVQGQYLRIGVKGGGCSGLSYVLGFDQKKDGDQEFYIDGIKVFMHKAHGLYLMGMQIAFQDGLNARGFTFNNPNAASTCGCGTSFSV